MPRALTQAQIDKVWEMIDADPTTGTDVIAEKAGVCRQMVWQLRKRGKRVAGRVGSISTGLWAAPRVKPRHVTAEQFSAEWWSQNDLGSKRLLMEMGRKMRAERVLEAAE